MKLTKQILLGLSLLFFAVTAFGSGKVIGVSDPAKVCGVVPAKVLGVVAAPGVPPDEDSAYGVAWNEDADTYARTEDTFGEALSSSLSDVLLPIQALMRRCVINDAGVVQYYLNATDSTLKAEGGASDLTGGDGQVMVQIPKFWYKYGYAGTTHTWEIANFAKDGYSVHPAFIKNEATVDYRYIGAYEGIKYDDGTSSYVDGVSAGIDTANDILSSVSGFAPWTDDTRAEVRAVAANRGIGWRQQDFDLVSAIQLLYIIEYADWHSQLMIGMGRTEISGASWIKDSYIGVTGKSNGDGNGTNSVAGNTNNAYMTYRGIENFFGNVYQWVDGININEHVPYVSNNDTHFADDTTTNYTALGVTLVNEHGYIKTLEQISRGFLPASVGGASNTYTTDYYAQNTGWRIGKIGGKATFGELAGIVCWDLNDTSTIVDASISGRLAF